MSKLIFDAVGSRDFEVGVQDCVLFPYGATATSFTEGSTNYNEGIAWNGIVSITQSPSGAEANPMYADNIKYINLISNEELGLTLEAYASPKEFDACDGTVEAVSGVRFGQQTRKMFGLCYKTFVGNDTAGATAAYKLHLIYGCQAAPSERTYSTINESPEAITLSWEISTTPVPVTGYKPLSEIEIDSTNPKISTLIDILYGKDAVVDPASPAIVAHLPMPDVIKTIMTPAAG